MARKRAGQLAAESAHSLGPGWAPQVETCN